MIAITRWYIHGGPMPYEPGNWRYYAYFFGIPAAIIALAWSVL